MADKFFLPLSLITLVKPKNFEKEYALMRGNSTENVPGLQS